MGQTLTKNLNHYEIALNKLDPKTIQADVLIVFGIQEGLFRSFSSWLKKGQQRFLVFVEENEELFLQAKATSLAKDPKVRLFFWKKGSEEIFQQIAWEFVFLQFSYGLAEGKNTQVAREFFQQLEHYHRGIDLLASDCEDMGQKVLTNAFANLQWLPRAKLGPALEGKCTGMTAIVCGAGPSLNQVAPLIAQLKDRAVIIAGGSAVRALNAHGIQPHLGAGFDPHPPHDRFLQQDVFETPFFYQGRISKEILAKVHGPLLWMPDAGNYPLEGWLAAECGVFAEKFESGWTVANFCAALAAHLGFSRVILTGMDFSCGHEQIYAGGIAGEENRNELIELEKDKLYSKRDWLMSAEWMSAFAQQQAQTQWINATAGGLDLSGISRQTLETIVFDTEMDIQARVDAIVLEVPFVKVTSEKVAEVRRKIKESFEKSLELCEGLLKIWEKYYPNSPLEKGDYAMIEVELEQQVCTSYFLKPLWNVWRRPILRTSFHPLGQHVHRLLFFKNALEMHLLQLRSYL